MPWDPLHRIFPNLLQDAEHVFSFLSISNFVSEHCPPWQVSSQQNITLDGKILSSLFSHPLFLSQLSFEKPARIEIGWVDVEEGAGPTTKTCIIPSILLNFNLFMALEDILSIVLRSCPGTALVRMNFGWKDLGFPLFSSPFPFHSFLLKNLQEWTLDGYMWREGQSPPQTRA